MGLRSTTTISCSRRHASQPSAQKHAYLQHLSSVVSQAYLHFSAHHPRTAQTLAAIHDKNKSVEPLLLVEDKNELRAMLRKALERAGYQVDEAPDGPSAIQKVRARRYLLVITDLKMPGASGLDVLRETKQADSTVPVLLLTAFGSVDEAVTAMKEGAFDFLQKPVDLEHLKLLVGRAARQQELLRENLILREEYSARYGFPRILGEDASIREVSQQIQKVAATSSTVLLLGESGTGKELVARAIHQLISARATSHSSPSIAPPFPKPARKRALRPRARRFHRRRQTAKSASSNSPTAARSFSMKSASCPCPSRPNCFASSKNAASNASAALNPSTSTFASWPPPIATCKSSPKKNFSAKIYISASHVVTITMPPLRSRGNDINLLADISSKNSVANSPSPASSFPRKPASASSTIRWPGNVRELQNTLERAVILADGVSIRAEDLQLPAPKPNAVELPEGMLPEAFNWEGSLEEVTNRAANHVEKVMLENTLRECTWNKTRAAEKLGVSPKTLLTKLRAAGLED